MNNVLPTEIAGSKSEPLSDIPPEAVKEFLAEMGSSASEEPAPDTKRTEVLPSSDLMQETQSDLTATEALVDDRSVTIAEEDRVLFMKALLNDQPLEQTISLFNHKFDVLLRSRTVFEQRRIFDVLQKDVEEKLIGDKDVNLYWTRFQQYCAAVMVRRINNNLFSEVVLQPNETLEESAKKLHAFAIQVEKLIVLRWTAILNAMRIFDKKCALMSTEAANEDFWNPRG